MRLIRAVSGVRVGEEAVVVGFYRRDDEQAVLKLTTGDALAVPIDALEVVAAARARAEPPPL